MFRNLLESLSIFDFRFQIGFRWFYTFLRNKQFDFGSGQFLWTSTANPTRNIEWSPRWRNRSENGPYWRRGSRWDGRHRGNESKETKSMATCGRRSNPLWRLQAGHVAPAPSDMRRTDTGRRTEDGGEKYLRPEYQLSRIRKHKHRSVWRLDNDRKSSNSTMLSRISYCRRFTSRLRRSISSELCTWLIQQIQSTRTISRRLLLNMRATRKQYTQNWRRKTCWIPKNKSARAC